MDGLPDLVAFAGAFEAACIDTLNDGFMTRDLCGLVEPGYTVTAVSSNDFIKEIRKRLEQRLGA
jgi:isocitrate dehydrogenase